MNEIEVIRKKVATAADAFIQYRNTPQSKEFLVLLEAMIEQYQHQLMHVTKDGLEKHQGAVMQLCNLRTLMLNPQRGINLIV